METARKAWEKVRQVGNDIPLYRANGFGFMCKQINDRPGWARLTEGEGEDPRKREQRGLEEHFGHARPTERGKASYASQLYHECVHHGGISGYETAHQLRAGKSPGRMSPHNLPRPHLRQAASAMELRERRQKMDDTESRPLESLALGSGCIAQGITRRLSLVHRTGIVMDERPLVPGFPVRGQSASRLRTAEASYHKGVSRSGEVFYRKATYPCHVNQKADWGA